MRRNLYTTALAVVFLFGSINVFSQNFTPSEIKKPVGYRVLESLKDATPIPPQYRDRTWKEKVIPNKKDFLADFQVPSTWTGLDPVLQDFQSGSRTSVTIDKNFDGQNNTSGVAPPDTQGDVGPAHYFQMVNLSFKIFNKNGSTAYGPADISTLWNGFIGDWTGTNDGDPVVLYDEVADRWLATQFSLPYYPAGPFYQMVAVSQTNDPTGAWYQYAYQFANMPDYPKFGIWPDGYYFTINQFKARSGYWVGGGVCVLDRTAMLNGNPNATMQFFNLGGSFGSLLPADFDGVVPPAGSPNYLAELTTSSLRIWTADINWSSPSSSTLNYSNLPVQSYNYTGITINQPGTSQTLDPLSDRLMYRLQYRNFGTYESMVTNHTVNVGNGQAGVRWYELRKSGGGNWSIYQQGTFAPADGLDRWMGSIAKNADGNIALGYSVSASSKYPSIRFAGQTAGYTPLGQLDITETSIFEGTKSQTGLNRWGDYSMMSVDPTNDLTFWYTTEYSNGGWNWKTRIASFNFGAPPVNTDPPVAQFIASATNIPEGTTINFTDQTTNNPTSWLWDFPGGTPASSTAQNPSVTYNTAGIYNVQLTATNAYDSDFELKTGYITVTALPTVYCSSQSNSASTDFIDQVSVGGFTKSSAGSTYSDYTSSVIQLTQGLSNQVILSPNTNNRKEFWRIWIDYNHDFDFADAGEQVFAANNKKGNATGSFIVPTTALTGQTRIRVSMKYGAAPTACETFANGEVEDYTVNISASQAPLAGISQGSDEKELLLELYPNPAGNNININVTGNGQKINVKVYNALGMIIEDFNIESSQASIDLGNYAKGIYYVGVDDGVKTALKKFIKE
ncbi:MAG TPA: GEVED domain-containing protein [Prolixibacteraceae bacterium]|nr:GEVED domain-containing protein [Lentimicrobium sp.]HLN73176.1 GEVED domain-containing protein [Prolixibacteraceae bacterium]